MNETTVYGVPLSVVRDAIMFHQKFKDMPTYQQILKQIKREHLELELARINAELEKL